MKKLGFGCMRLPLIDPNKIGEIDIDSMCKMVDAYMEAGFNYFDTAYYYHDSQSEAAVKKVVVERYPRESYFLTDKMPMFVEPPKEKLPEIFAEQLERTGVEYFDLYLLHSLGQGSYEHSEKVGAFEYIKQLKSEGKVRHIGFSFHDKADLLDKMLEKHPEIEFVQLQINYIDWEDGSIESRRCYEVCRKHGKKIIVMEPVKGGALASLPQEAEDILKAHEPDLSVASWAIRYAASIEDVFVVLSGMSNMDQVLDNISYMKEFKPYGLKEYELIDKVVGIVRSSIAIPCTACRYCTDGCPKDIAIPEYFAAYNNYKKFGKVQRIVAETYHDNIAEFRGKAKDCIGCGQCESHCPQHIEIIDWLKEVANTFETKE